MSADDMHSDGVADLERFRVDSRAEIVRVLNDLTRTLQLITVYFNEGRDFILTSALRLDDENNRLVLDYGPDDTLNQRLLDARHGFHRAAIGGRVLPASSPAFAALLSGSPLVGCNSAPIFSF